MSIFLIAPTDPADGFDETVAAAFPGDSYRLPKGEWLVRFNGTTRELSDKLRISGGESGSALVLSVGHYWGWASNDIWEWIALKESQG